ncbi:unnamed protein product [Urochloa decumbens]|uniref:Uncharacterized protein n=1 Tax=Urochloa decumbens TaxID=240449 RepID=A0ABC8V7W0_9POAL
MPRGFGPGGDEAVVDLWAMAADLERQFAGYKQRLADRDDVTPARDHDDDTGGGGGDGCVYEEEEEEAAAGGRSSISSGDGDVRGRMYEAYVRRRDERLREGWRARMERKEAEVKALWAQLELAAAGRAGAGAEKAPGCGGDPTVAATTAGDESKTERSDDDKRRSSDTALAPRRITGKKHARTRSFSSSMTTSMSRSRSSDAGMRRALSQEPLPSEPHASAETSTENQVRRPSGGAATTTATTARPKTSLRRKSSVKGHGSAKLVGPKVPRSLPRRASSGALEALGREVVLPQKADSAAPVQSSSPPSPFVIKNDRSDVTCEVNARVASPESDRGEVVEAVSDGEPEAKNADVEECCCEEKVDDASPDMFGNPNGEITASDSETEPSYVYINKDVIEEQAMTTVSEPLKLAAGSDDDSNAKTNEEVAEATMQAPADAATAAEIATTNAEEAPARESSADESSFSVRSGLSARPSCSSRDQSIERLLEADAALLRKKREEQRAEKSTATPKTPGSAGSRVSGGAARSPRETVRGIKKFLSFGKKNRGREVTVVIDCTSPSVPSLADDDSASGGWHSGGSIKPRMGSSDAASDDTDDHGYPASPRACSLQSLVAASPAKSELAEIVPQEKTPKAHRSFFSFRSLNCGRG